jgi:hypothetical protein
MADENPNWYYLWKIDETTSGISGVSPGQHVKLPDDGSVDLNLFPYAEKVNCSGGTLDPKITYRFEIRHGTLFLTPDSPQDTEVLNTTALG